MESLVGTYKGKRVLVTGHTGFKGSWLCEWLLELGAEVHGFALPPPTEPSLFMQLELAGRLATHTIGDIRDTTAVDVAVANVAPDFVFHLAAQPLVRRSYREPVETFATNVMGTVHVLDAVRRFAGTQRPCNVVCITSDKCYENRETSHPYREDDPMGGHDPYSCSKGCAELVVASYRRSYFGNADSPVWVASARAGNVIGGGDWAEDRIVPDFMRALAAGEPMRVRNKHSTRPWQHVLEPLSGYLVLGATLAQRRCFDDISDAFNFGPDPSANRTVAELADALTHRCGGRWEDYPESRTVHEARLLNLDISKASRIIGWKPHWNFSETLDKTVEWYVQVHEGGSPKEITRRQIAEYERSEP